MAERRVTKMAKKRFKSLVKSVISWTLISLFFIAVLVLPALYAYRGVCKIHDHFDRVVQANPYSGVLVVEMEQGQGSCFVVAYHDNYYYAITARHVVEIWNYYDPEPIFSSALTVDDEQYEAEIVRVGADEDVALIRFKSPETYTIYSFGSVEVGDVCYTVGYSRGAKLVYRGYVVTLDFDGHVVANGGVVPGCSGGVLLNADGEAVGITVALPIYSGLGFDSTAMHVPIRFAEALMVAEGIR